MAMVHLTIDGVPVSVEEGTTVLKAAHAAGIKIPTLCWLKDINEIFMDTGLGREGYSIIGQGKIDEILSVKSGERREVFEEAAGISKFRHRKEESERKLQRTEENLVRINDKIAELELQVEPLRQQAETAKKYLVLRDELRVLEISVWLENLQALRAGALKLETDLRTAQEDRQRAQEDLDAVYAAGEESLEKIRDNDVRAEALRKRLEVLVQADAEAFLPVAAAYKLPKETPEQQAHKAAVLEKALDRACAVPLEVMTACGEGIALAAEYAEKGSVLARSDAGCAALFCKAAMQAAGLNVKVNTRLMADKAHADALEARAEQLLAEFVPQADRVYQTVSNE